MGCLEDGVADGVELGLGEGLGVVLTVGVAFFSNAFEFVCTGDLITAVVMSIAAANIKSGNTTRTILNDTPSVCPLRT